MGNSSLRYFAAILCCFLFVSFVAPVSVYATDFPIRRPSPDVDNDPNDPNAAQNISGAELISDHPGFGTIDHLFNKKKFSGRTTDATASLTLEYSDGIGYLYFIFLKEYGDYTVINNDTGERVICGTNRFLHEVIDFQVLFGGPVSSVTVDFSNGPVGICELYVYTPGYLPDYVQQWEPAKEGKTDLILFSTHGDDDQLFFAGILPYYSALDYEVLVVYLTDHRNNVNNRIHEMLNGLWAVGIRTYPVFGSFHDFFCEYLSVAYTMFEQLGTSKEDIISFITEQLRRYKPQVVVGHDFKGEYGHGQHMVYADTLAAALAVCNDSSQYSESAEKYGTWEVPKAYFHLYEENQIVMDWDTPMEELDGMTPFEVTQLRGYPQHESQSNSWVSTWINGSGFSIRNASQILKYSPCLFGLYQTTVGADVEKNNFFENLTSYAEQARIAEEQRLEAERLAAEEAKRQEEARIAEEKRLAEEEARRQAEEAARLAEEQRRAEEAAQKRRNAILLFAGGGSALLIAAILLIVWIKAATKRRKKNF